MVLSNDNSTSNMGTTVVVYSHHRPKKTFRYITESNIVYRESNLVESIQEADNDSYQELSDMGGVKEYRNNKRLDHEATILIEDIPEGTYYHGKMVNYSDNGMCFESHIAHEPGAPIFYSIENSPYPECPGVYNGLIRWCRKLPETASLYSYGLGVEYFKPGLLNSIKEDAPITIPHTPAPSDEGVSSYKVEEATNRIKDAIEIERTLDDIPDSHKSHPDEDKEHRKHSRRSFDRPILYATRNRFFKGTIKDISKGGVFIEAPDMMAVGQRLTLAIPSGRQGRGLKLRGEIVRIDPEGLAIQFKSIIKN